MKLSFSTLLFLLLFGFSMTVSGAPADTEKVFIQFEEEIDYAYLDSIGAKIKTELPAVPGVIAEIPSTSQQDSFRLATSHITIEEMPEDDLLYLAAETPSWGYTAISADRSYSFGYTGRGVKVGIIDSGISDLHPDLKIKGGVSFFASSHLRDTLGHGTHVAGIVAAQANTIGVRGVAPEVDLYSIRVFDSGGFTTSEIVAKGVQWAIDNKMDILNMSLSGSADNPALREVLRAAADRGILIVAASGNDWVPTGNYADVLYPARYPFVVAVGSIDQNRAIATDSFRGPSQEFVAPGVGINSTFSSATNGAAYQVLEGTSMATPFVVGVAAQYMQVYPSMSTAQVRKLMQQDAQDLGVAGRDSRYGFGMVRALRREIGIFPDTYLGLWYTHSLDYIVNKDLVTGFPDGTFQPNRALTRAEAVTLIGRALDLDTSSSQNVYSDVSPNSFATPYINAATELGYIQGIGGSKFAPSAPIKRGDMALIMQNVYDYVQTKPVQFADVNATKYYAAAIQAGADNGVWKGYPNGTFLPDRSITRIEFVEILANALQLEQSATN